MLGYPNLDNKRWTGFGGCEFAKYGWGSSPSNPVLEMIISLN